jgi:hypothetical protein
MERSISDESLRRCNHGERQSGSLSLTDHYDIRLATYLWAETPASKIEVFGGYSLMYGDFEQHREEAHGWAASVASKLNENFAVVADFSGHFKHSDFVLGARPASRTIAVNFLFGPHFMTRHRFLCLRMSFWEAGISAEMTFRKLI